MNASTSFPCIQTRQSFFKQLSAKPYEVDAPVDEIRIAPYTLNKDKQIRGLGNNATAQDFIVDVTDDTNAAVHCSTGFYEAVVKPSLSGLGEGYADVLDGVPVRCIGRTLKIDQLGRNVNHVLRFISGFQGQTKNTTIHLHHSQQHVQVQGEGTLWFLDHFLKDLFTKGSKNKHFDIRIAPTVPNNLGQHPNQPYVETVLEATIMLRTTGALFSTVVYRMTPLHLPGAPCHLLLEQLLSELCHPSLPSLQLQLQCI